MGPTVEPAHPFPAASRGAGPTPVRTASRPAARESQAERDTPSRAADRSAMARAAISSDIVTFLLAIRITVPVIGPSQVS